MAENVMFNLRQQHGKSTNVKTSLTYDDVFLAGFPHFVGVDFNHNH